MILTHVNYINSNFEKEFGEIEIEHGKLKTLGEGSEATVRQKRSMNGLTALPGFVDIHTHGGNNADTCDIDPNSMNILSEYYAKMGTTSFCPTTMTLSVSELKRIFAKIENYKGNEIGAYIHGINMEGPYVSAQKCGAQNKAYIKAADFDEFSELNSISKISLVDVAPETAGAMEFAKKASELTTVSIAHTNADYAVAAEASANGFTHVTHFMNAMSAFESRSSGVVGAVLEDDKLTAEMICDGFHLAPSTVKILFKILGDDRPVVISDSLSCAGCEDGDYALGGQKVIVKNGEARLENGTIAGSSSNMFAEFRNLLEFGIDFKSALKACTINPCKAIGVDDVCGSIEVGKNADMIFVDENFELKHVMVKGEFVF
ncbi:MAG: N-acetylglucosamine-6-phosphate deacetylase [Clostridia bacterium]